MTVLLSIVTGPSSHRPPPPTPAVLPDTVLSDTTVTDSESLEMPPPYPPLVFCDTVLFNSVNEPPGLIAIPPPDRALTLSVTTLFDTVNEPDVETPPPRPTVEPSRTVNPSTVTPDPAPIWSTVCDSAPEMVVAVAPFPWMINDAAVFEMMVGVPTVNVEKLRVKTIRSMRPGNVSALNDLIASSMPQPVFVCDRQLVAPVSIGEFT